MRKYLNYIIFGLIVLLVVGVAINHSRHMRYLVDSLVSGTPAQRKDAAAELIAAEQFSDAITGESITTRKKAAEALAILNNTDGVKQAVGLLKDPDKPVRQQAIVTLEQIGASKADNLKELMNGLKDGDLNVRQGTITALTDPNGGIGPRTNPDVVAAVIDIMKREGGARGPGGDVLSSPLFEQHGANARSVPALLALLDDKDDGVRQGAADALGKIGDPAALPKLIAVMHNPQTSPAVRRIAIGSIALIASPQGEAALTEAVTNPNDDNEARTQAAVGLGKIGTPTAIATLIKALMDDDNNIRSAAVTGLVRAAQPAAGGASAPPKPTVVAQLTQALRDPKKEVRLGVAEAMQQIHAPASDPALSAVLNGDSKDSDVRIAAATALGFPGNQAAVTPLIKALSDPDGEVANAATRALAAIGPPATTDLIALTQHGGTEAYYAAKALGEEVSPEYAQTDPQGSAQTLAALEKAAQQTSNPVGQRWAAIALGETRRQAVVPTLQQLARSSDPDVAYVAKEQLDHLSRTQ